MPQPREIMKQLNVIYQQWDHFAYESRDFNMKLERKQPRTQMKAQGPVTGPDRLMPKN